MKTIKIKDEHYPKLLREVPNAPEKLFYKGTWDPALFKNCLAVVGTRRMTRYGKEITHQIVSAAASAGITIVSGFMYGVDIEAHKAALSVGGKTIAVMPCGIDLIHPEYQEEEYNEICARDGLILSEWEGKYPAQTWTFPQRNRIVAGICEAILVIEAPKGSGSLITSDIAGKLGREVFAIPHELTRPAAAGVAHLQEQGAILVQSADTILNFFDLERVHNAQTKNKNGEIGMGGLEGSIIEVLQREPTDADTLARELGKPARELGTTLSLMLLEGYIKEEGGIYYAN